MTAKTHRRKRRVDPALPKPASGTATPEPAMRTDDILQEMEEARLRPLENRLSVEARERKRVPRLGVWIIGFLGVCLVSCLHLGPRPWTPTDNEKEIRELTIAWQGGARIKKLPKGDYVWSYVENPATEEWDFARYHYEAEAVAERHAPTLKK